MSADSLILLDSWLVFSYTGQTNSATVQQPMKAIILSAGQGKRLLPLTAATPKCLLPVDGSRPALEIQLRTLAACGIQRATVMVGFGADKVEHFLARCPLPEIEVTTRFNPFFALSNNLATCWTAIPEMTEDFVLLNGDTLFEPAVLERLLRAPFAAVSLAIDRKPSYDEDDMKVSIRHERTLAAVGKTLPPAVVHGESIGLMTFRASGVPAFRVALEKAMRDPTALQRWYLSVIDALAHSSLVEVTSIEGLWWAETDTPEDLAEVRAYFSSQQAALSAFATAAPVGEP